MLAGLAYFAIGRTFTWPTTHVQGWRLGAWFLCAVLYALHLWYEYLRSRHVPRVSALHVAVGVAIGGFALAVAGMMHSFSSSSTIGSQWLVALIVFPAVTGIPAFLIAWVITALADRGKRS